LIRGGIKGIDKTLKKARKAADSFERARDMALKESALLIHETAVRIVTENSVGTDGKRSEPFEAPFKDTGTLSKSIKMDFSEKGVAKIGSNLKYAAWLEFGTENMAPRPWLSTAVEESSKRVADIFQKWFDKAMKELAE
jgi:HK97 gp10 family phage protein